MPARVATAINKEVSRFIVMPPSKMRILPIALTTLSESEAWSGMEVPRRRGDLALALVGPAKVYRKR